MNTVTIYTENDFSLIAKERNEVLTLAKITSSNNITEKLTLNKIKTIESLLRFLVEHYRSHFIKENEANKNLMEMLGGIE